MEKVGNILLHVCCAPCAVGCVERLREEGRCPVLFFANSNLATALEFERRLDSVRRLAEAAGLPLLVDGYRHDDWRAAVAGFEAEPEGGRRCRACFDFSLRRTAAQAAELGIDAFTTSLTVSPHKNSAQIFDVGAAHPGFVACDFKKRDGFKRSRELAKQYGFYFQDFCGCEYSKRSLMTDAP